MNRELTIIGGGIAGLGLANGLIRQEVPVRLIEAGSYPRHRVCGEFITSLSGHTVDALGIRECLQDAVVHQSIAWYRNGKRIRQYTLPSPALGISRYCLDQRMAEVFIEKGGQLQENTRDKTGPGAGRILATGRQPSPGGRTGLKGHWRKLSLRADLEVHLGTGCYLGISGVEDGYVNVCGLFNTIAKGSFPSPLERFMATLDQFGFDSVRRRLEDAEFREGSFCSVTGLEYTMEAGYGIGDACRQIPPFTGHGMTLAFEAAAAAVPIAMKWSRGELTGTTFEEQLHAHMTSFKTRRYRAARLLHPFLMQPTLQSFLALLSRARMIPFQSFYQLTHS